MKDEKTRKLVYLALFTALTTAATMVVRVPSPTGGYVNAGDAVVLLCAFVLGPVPGAVAAGIGSALADIFGSYFLYAPATLVIKGLTALVAGLLILSVLALPFVAGAWMATLGLAVLAAAVNWPLLRYMNDNGGPLFALRALLYHQLY